MHNFFSNLFDSTAATLSPGVFILCIFVALLLGAAYAAVYTVFHEGGKSFAFALLALPAAVAVTIMMVNGSIGMGVAVAGAFSLVRFRSAQGTAKEITVIFMAMCSGLLTGIGYFGYGALFTLLMCLILAAGGLLAKYAAKGSPARMLKITVPEDMNFPEVMDGILGKYAKDVTLVQTKTTAMGTLYRLTYRLNMRPGASEKSMIDDLRTHNGNLEILLMKGECDHDL